MKCALCNGRLVNKLDVLEFNSKSIGKVLIPNIKFTECQSCKDKILAPKEFDKAVDFIAREEKRAISNLPIREFITANEAARILGITKQAFSKHPKIKRGLIYSVKIDDRKLYNRKSVELFKEKGNGKFLLSKPDVAPIYTKKEILEHYMSKKFKIIKTPKTVFSHGTFISHTQKRC